MGNTKGNTLVLLHAFFWYVKFVVGSGNAFDINVSVMLDGTQQLNLGDAYNPWTQISTEDVPLFIWITSSVSSYAVKLLHLFEFIFHDTSLMTEMNLHTCYDVTGWALTCVCGRSFPAGGKTHHFSSSLSPGCCRGRGWGKIYRLVSALWVLA